jgi:PHD/YefM family antitoxin component YafN of YafNO toxin-antitoxin module
MCTVWGEMMGLTTVAISEFHRHPEQVKKAAEQVPVFITRYGRIEYVLLTFEDYTKLTGAKTAEKQTNE